MFLEGRHKKSTSFTDGLVNSEIDDVERFLMKQANILHMFVNDYNKDLKGSLILR